MTREHTLENAERLNTKLIVQVGRLDFHYRSEIEFTYEGEIGKSILSSSFLMNTRDFKDAERLIIYPVSLVFQDNLITLKDDPFIEKIANTQIKDYLDNPKEFFKQHPQSIGADRLVVSSMGKYKIKGEEYVLSGNLDVIMLQIYLYLISYYSYDDLEEIYCDISSGQNIYIAALMNALYRFLPFVRFKRFLFSRNKSVSGWILNSDPIIGKPDHTISIQKSKFGAKAFNSLAFKEFENIRPLIKCIFKGKEYYKDLVRLLESEYLLLHSALIRGTPLLLTLVDGEVLSKLFSDEGSAKIIEDLLSYYSVENVGRIGENDASRIFLMTFALAIAHAIYRRFETVISEKAIIFQMEEQKEGAISIRNKDLDNAFALLKDEFGQPEPNYKDEILKMIGPFNRIERDDYVSFVDLKKEATPNYSLTSEFNPRNFFAHGGMELNTTKIKVVENSVCVCYNTEMDEKKRKSILKYLKK